MKLKILIFAFISFANVSLAQKYSETGLASYYGTKFHGRKTANGERFNMKAFTSAHRSLPFNSLVKVTNLSNGKTVVVRVNDRGPVSKKRIIDLSKAAAEKIGMVSKGVVKVKVELLNSVDINDEEMIAECCYGELGTLDPLLKFDFYGNKLKTDGATIAENFITVFTRETVEASFPRVIVDPIIFSSIEKKRRR